MHNLHEPDISECVAQFLAEDGVRFHIIIMVYNSTPCAVQKTVGRLANYTNTRIWPTDTIDNGHDA